MLSQEEVLVVLHEAITHKMTDKLKWYNSPLDDIVTRVVEENADELYNFVSSSLWDSLKSKNFKKIVNDEFMRKVAKSLVSKLEWAVEKSVNDYRSNPVLKWKMITALENIINENQ